MFRRSLLPLTATPSSFKLLGTTMKPPARNGVGRENKMRSKPSDNTALYDKGPVEWIPRPVRLTYAQLDQLRDFMMRETLHPNQNINQNATNFHQNNNNNNTCSEVVTEIRRLHHEWSGHPLLPVLGDSEPRFPHNLYKQNHRARHRFIVRWHKANSPQHWLWLPRGQAMERVWPESWRQYRQKSLPTKAEGV
ncbi:hypothetical protein AGDE_05671 [Angomonas deanei]|nr:hypothetical protein AGDE_06384 [Angomonas deanei]EPY38258.1 hypothetical protein AGDE_05671 [Angomonas deanei]|eukprot:EPY37550.1 hypothetical protein AGDE_06384 [Angomonas deanei]